MNSDKQQKMTRRMFFGLSSGFLVTGSLFGWTSFQENKPSQVESLPEELNDEELESIKNSAMAKNLSGYFGKGYSCAESLWMVALEHMNKPEELGWIASGFGGGMYHKDLCGFLTAGIMAIGLSAGTLDMERREAKDICGDNVKEYWSWWKSIAPLKCSDIRQEGTSSKVCQRIGQLATAKVESLIQSDTG
jgi:hypothetical protein